MIRDMKTPQAEGMHAAPTLIPLVLAAGDSRRMGFPKALLPLGDKIFLTAILEKLAVAGLAEPAVILGRDALRIEPRLAGRDVRVLINPDPDRGQLSSIQIGISALPAGTEGCLIWPVDQPHVSAGLAGRLVRMFRESQAPLVVPEYAGRKGHPAIFGRSLFAELLQAPMGGGAKPVVQRHIARAAILPTDEAAVTEDIDTPEDFQRLTGMTPFWEDAEKR